MPPGAAAEADEGTLHAELQQEQGEREMRFETDLYLIFVSL